MADVRRAWHTITEFGAWWESEIITRLVRAESITETEKGKGITISQGHASGCIGVSGYGDACRSLGELCIPWKRQKNLAKSPYIGPLRPIVPLHVTLV